MGTIKPLAALHRAGLVSFGQKAQPGSGRPFQSVQLTADGGYSFGIVIRQQEVHFGLVNLQNKLIDFQAMPFNFRLQNAALILEPEFADAFYGQVDRQYLFGYWKFKPEINLLEQRGSKIVSTDPKMTKAPATDPGMEQGYFKLEFDASAWSEIPAPWSWNIVASPVEEKKSNRIAFAGLGYYRLTFQVPKEKSGKRIFLHFDSVQTECKIWPDGVEVGQHTNSTANSGEYWAFNRRLFQEDFELDVTDRIKCGVDNTLVLRVFDDGQPIIEAYPNDGGIMGPVWIDFRETVDFSEMLVNADVDGSVVMQARAVNAGGQPVTLPMVAQVEPFRSKFYTPPAAAKPEVIKLGEIAFPKGEGEHRLTFKVPDVVPWDVNCPALYRMRLTDGRRILGQTRVGFRRMEVRGKRFYLNGHPIYLHGVNPGNGEYWHSRLWPSTSRTGSGRECGYSRMPISI